MVAVRAFGVRLMVVFLALAPAVGLAGIAKTRWRTLSPDRLR